MVSSRAAPKERAVSRGLVAALFLALSRAESPERVSPPCPRARARAAAEVIWVPPSGCARGGPLAPAAATLVDAVSTDLWTDPSRCPCPHALSAANLARAVAARETVTHFFALGVVDASGLVAAVGACRGAPALEVVCLNECAVTAELLRALARHGASLKGIYLHLCKVRARARRRADRIREIDRAVSERARRDARGARGEVGRGARRPRRDLIRDLARDFARDLSRGLRRPTAAATSTTRRGPSCSRARRGCSGAPVSYS